MDKGVASLAVGYQYCGNRCKRIQVLNADYFTTLDMEAQV